MEGKMEMEDFCSDWVLNKRWMVLQGNISMS